MKDNFKDKVLQTIKKNDMIESGDKVILGVSGGPDSIAMLNVLLNIKNEGNINFDIIVAHVNHKIRVEASQDEAFVCDFCKKNNVQFFSKSIDIPQIAHDKKIGEEEAGRYERYKFFDEIMSKTKANKIAIAHNQNDKAETILMNLLRGTGILGLKGIEFVKDEKYIRPLLDCTRAEIENYCKIQNLEPRIDKTNFDNTYTRNKVRNVVIPYVQKEFNPNFIKALIRLSELVKEEEEYVQNQVEIVYKEVLIVEKTKKVEEYKKITNNYNVDDVNICEDNKNYIVLNLKKFNNKERVIKSRVLLYTITRLLGSTQGIEKIHVDDMVKLCERNIGNKYLTPNKKLRIFLKNGKIYLIDQR